MPKPGEPHRAGEDGCAGEVHIISKDQPEACACGLLVAAGTDSRVYCEGHGAMKKVCDYLWHCDGCHAAGERCYQEDRNAA